MNTLISQISRMFWDDGRRDRDFSDREERLVQAQRHLREAAAGLVQAADLLSDFLKSRQ